MSFCRIHGKFEDAYDGCPTCREVEERAERDREEQREAAEIDREERRASEERAEAAREDREYKRANPGDYGCPSCGYKTLLRSRPRCPICHADIPDDYWTRIIDGERREAEERERLKRLAAEEWERARPERERRAAEARQVADQAAAVARQVAEQAAAVARQKAVEARSKAALRGGIVGLVSGVILAFLCGALAEALGWLDPQDEGGHLLFLIVGSVIGFLIGRR